jgi:hypothetical protein
MKEIIIIILLLILIILYNYYKNRKIEGFSNLESCDLINMELDELEILDRDPVYIKLLEKLIRENKTKLSNDDYKAIINRFQFYKINSDKINYDNITKKIMLDCKLLLNEHNILDDSTTNKHIIDNLFNNSLHNNIINSFNSNLFSLNSKFYNNYNNNLLNLSKNNNNLSNLSNNNELYKNDNNKDKSDIIKMEIDEEEIRKLEDIKRRYRNDMKDIENKDYRKYYYDIDEKRVECDIKSEFINYYIDKKEC